MSDSEGDPEEEDESVDFDFLESAEGQITTLRPTPFEPQVEEVFDDVGALSGFYVTFNQAYIFNTVSYTQYGVPERDPRKISNMATFELPANHSIEYLVEVVINADNFLIQNATFTGLSGLNEEGDEGSNAKDDLQWQFPHVVFDQYDADVKLFTGYFPILKLENGELEEFTQRSNIVLSDRQFRQKGVSSYNNSAHILKATNRKDENYPVRVRAIEAGSGIVVQENGDYITIHNTGEGGGGSSGWSGENCPSPEADWEAYKEGSFVAGTSAAQFRGLNAGKGINFSQDAHGEDSYCDTKIKFDAENCSSTADWYAYKGFGGGDGDADNEKAQFRGLSAGCGISFAATDDCVTEISTRLENCDSAGYTPYKSCSAGGVEQFHNLKPDPASEVEITISADGDGCGYTIGASCCTSYDDLYVANGIHHTADTDTQFSFPSDGTAQIEADGVVAASFTSTTATLWGETSTCATTTIHGHVTYAKCASSTAPSTSYKDGSNTVVSKIDANASNPTFFNAGPVAIGQDSASAGTKLDVKGLCKVQDPSTSSKGVIQLGDNVNQIIKVETTDVGYPSLKLGSTISKLEAEYGGDYFEVLPQKSATYSSFNSQAYYNSPATGSAILGGSGNFISGNFNVITAGANNMISGKSMNFIGGGSGVDIVDSEFAVSVGGRNNDISGANWSVIAGGYNNTISGKNTNSIGGGYSNEIRGVFASVIAGGYDNLVSGNLESAGAIVGGVNNKVEKSHYGFVGAGASNTIQEESDGAVIVGGLGNTLYGTNSFIGGGRENVVSGTYGVALGSFSKVRHNGAFVFTDGIPLSAFSSGDNTLLMSFKSGVYVQSDSGLYVNGEKVVTTSSEADTLQTVTDRGSTTTNNITLASSLPKLFLQDTDGTNQIAEISKAGSHLYFYNRDNASNGGYIFLGDNGTTDTEFMRIATDGDVGIGSNTPSAKLDVAGGIKLLDNNYLTWNSSNTRIVGNSDYLQLQVAASDKVRIQSDGNVGIGTTTPRTTLHVSKAGATEGGILTIDNPNNTDGAYCGIEFINSTVGYPRSAIFAMRTGGYDAELTFHTSPTNEITGTDYPAATERMRIDHDGKVGIGTNDPSAQLTVSGDGIRIISTGTNAHNGEARIGVAGNNSRPNFELGPSNNSDEFQIINGGQWKVRTTNDVDLAFGVNSSDVIYIEGTNENVGIGTTSPQKAAHLYVDGNDGLRIQSSNNHAFTQIMAHTDYSAYIQFRDGANRYWIQSTTDDKLRFRPNATSLESATINFDATGNVGIGVLSPSQKLEVGTNTDVSAQIGRAHVGSVGYGDYAGFAHLDQASTSSYALLQGPNGNTFLNCANGKQLYFRRNHVNVGGFNTNSDFYVDTDTLYVDASADSVGINDSTPSYPLDVNGIIRTQSGLLGTQFGTGPCTTIDGFFASTSTEDYGFQNALLMNDLAGFTKWAGVTIATSGLYKTRGGSAGSYTYSNEAGTGDFDRAFQANNHTVGSWYTDSGPDGDITTGVASTGVIELYFNGVKSLNYSAQAAAIFGSASFRATHVKIEALRTGAWQTILDTTENTKTALIARIASNGGGANATTGLRYSFARAGNYFRINNLYAADYDLGNDLSYGGQYYIDKYYDGRHYADLRPVTDGGANLGTSSVRYGSSYIDYGRFTNNVGIGTNTLTYNLNVVSNSDILAHFKSTDNKASILLQDDDTAAYVSVENNILALGPQNGTNAAQNLNYNVTNYRLGIGTNVPDLPLHVKGTGIRLEESGAARHLDILPASAGINHKFIGDNTSAGYEFHNNGGLLASFDNVNNYFANNVGIGSATPAFELDVVGTIHGTSGNFENGITIDGNPVVTGTSAFESDTLQTVTDQGATTTNDITVADLLVQNNGQVRANGSGSLTLGNTNGGTIYVSGHGGASVISPRFNHLYLESTRDEDDIIFQAGEAGVEMARFDSANQRLGIGTTDPNQLLHVDGKTQLGTNGFTEGGLIINYASLSETKGGAATLLGNAVYAGTTSNTFRRTKGDAGNYIRMTYNKGICFHTNVTGNTSDDYSIDNHEQMRITTGGSVGIGTTEPAKTLDIDGDTRVKNAEFQVTSSSAYTTHLNYLDGGNNYISQANGGGTFFRNNGGTLVSISSVGTLNVGAAGVTNTRLHVTGAASDSLAKFKDGSDGVEITTRGASRQQIDFLGSNTSAINAKGSLFINYDSDNGGSNDTITFARNGVDEAGTVDMIIKEGNVGIGTTSPAHQLHLNKENAIAEMQISRDGSDPSTDTDIGRIQFKTDYSSSPNEVGSIWVRTNSSAYRTDMRFGVKATAGSEEVGLTIHGTSDGPFVGVGTTNPTQTFHVKAEQDGDYVARITNTEATAGANYGLKVDGGSNASDVTFEASSLAGTSHLKVQGDGKVGIGSTSPARKLDVSTNSSDTYGIRNSYGPSHYMEMAHNRFNAVGNNYIRFNIDDSTKMTIVDSDFGGGVNGVGIGTTSPSYELDVVGTTRSTYYIGGAYLEENASSSKLKFYTDGTVLVMDEDGELKPCEKENDTLVFGVSKRDFDSPVVLGAEPILVTGPIKVGDYIVTSSKQGHGQAMKEQKLGTIIAQAMESGDGESYNIKAMIRKM